MTTDIRAAEREELKAFGIYLEDMTQPENAVREDEPGSHKKESSGDFPFHGYRFGRRRNLRYRTERFVQDFRRFSGFLRNRINPRGKLSRRLDGILFAPRGYDGANRVGFSCFPRIDRYPSERHTRLG